jgi:tetratricopeptide (TPR) repeat protein/glycosyltransferase involved in cell wall biosynthesis
MAESEPLRLAQHYHRTGQFAAAARVCRRILKQQPDHAEALHLLAMTLHRSGNLSEAINCYQQILSRNPTDAQVHNNLGVALRAQGNLDAAIHAYQQALRLQPDSPGVYNNLGNLLRQQGKRKEAIVAYQQALAIDPAHADSLSSLGQVLREQGEPAAAIAHGRQVLTLRPKDPEAHNNLGNALQAAGEFAAAIDCYQQALTLQPDSPAFYNNLGAALQELGRNEASIAAYQQALTLKPDYADAYYNLGNALKDQDRFEDCVAAYQQALRLQPNYSEAYNNLGLVLYELGKIEQAIVVYQQALALKPDYPDAHLNLSLSLLLAGDLARGFREYEYRWQVQGKNFKPPRAFAQPLWDGSDLSGKTILLHAEQGFGDTIQFIRYAPLVTQRGGRVVVECQAALIRLIQPMSAIDQIVPAGSDLPKFDVHAPLLSLPYLLQTTLDAIPAEPYLVPPQSTVPLDGTGLKIGIVWAGSPDHQNDRRRSCPLAHFLNLLNVPGTQFYSLQKGARSADLPQAAGHIQDLSAQLSDFADTAAAIGQLDLVITVDTAVAHVAGAINRPVWVLLSFAPDWRWLQHRRDSPWYPTMRLFRQSAPGDWAGTIAQVKIALLNLLGTIAHRQHQWSIAVGYYQQALALDPTAAEVHLNLGNTLRRLDRREMAIAHYRQAVSLDPGNVIAHNNLGVTLRQQGDPEGAIVHYRQALMLDPNYPDTHFNLANALRDQDDFVAAVQHYRRAIVQRPQHTDAWINLGNTLKSQGKVQEAIDCYRRVLAIDPHHASAHNNLGHALLLSGDLPQGFAENEWRWQVANYKPPRPPLPQPMWDGSDLSGKTILLYAEQGFGDTIQFIRYVPLVAQRGGTVIVECQPLLVRLLQTVAGIDRVIPRGEVLPKFDVQAPLLSLPHLFGTTLDRVPAEISYLSAKSSELKLGESPVQFKVGLVWAGSPTNRNDRHRSCRFADLAPLLQIPGVCFYSLQKGDRASELQQCSAATSVIDLSDQLNDFADTAAAVAQLDLVISVDTAVAHLAGALGKPVWLMLCTDPDWRWLLDRSNSPWYPTVRLFRQSHAGDWSTVIAEIQQTLRATVLPALIPEAVAPPNCLGIGWQLSAATGWGTYGTYLALHLLEMTVTPTLLLPPATSVPWNPLHQKRLQPVFDRGSILDQTRTLNFPIFKSLGNQFLTAPELAECSGSKTIGVIFSEDTHLTAAALTRAKAFDRIVAGSTWNAEVLKSYGLPDVETVFQGIDPTIFHPAPKSGLFGDRFVIFSGGKLEYRKGQDIVICAFKAFHARYPEALLLTAWHNTWAKTMRGLEQTGYVEGLPQVAPDGRLAIVPWLATNGIPDTAAVDLGVVPNHLMGQILCEADVALFPSRCEGGTNLAAMESLACGIPTLLSANTGHLDLLAGAESYALRSQRPVQAIDLYQGYEGWGESDVEEVIAALEAVYTNRSAAHQQGATAAQFMRDWTWDQQIQRLLAAIDR